MKDLKELIKRLRKEKEDLGTKIEERNYGEGGMINLVSQWAQIGIDLEKLETALKILNKYEEI